MSRRRPSRRPGENLGSADGVCANGFKIWALTLKAVLAHGAEVRVTRLFTRFDGSWLGPTSGHDEDRAFCCCS